MRFSRRDFVKTMGTGALGAGVAVSITNPLGLASPGSNQLSSDQSGETGILKMDNSHPVRVNNPVTLGTWELPADRIFISLGYKPSMALLPNGELVLVSLLQEAVPGSKKVRARTPLWRSKDGGITWSQPVILEDMLGREQWLTCTSDGTLFASSHFGPWVIDSPYDYTHSYLHRSTDGGHSWQRTPVLLEGGYEKLGDAIVTGRNVVELPDKTLLFGVSIVHGNASYFWSSRDGGQSWDRRLRVKVGEYRNRPYENENGLFSEGFIYRNAAGKLLNFMRVSPPEKWWYGKGGPSKSPSVADLAYPMNDRRVPPNVGDGGDRMLVCKSTDEGRTWENFRDLGDYGMHYPRVLRLRDGRLLMTFTQRALFYPLGLRAIFSHDDGETWNFNMDHIVIEGSTPWGVGSGGGFGNTLQLEDGTLVSCYSYYPWDDQKAYLKDYDKRSRIMVVRWQLSAS